MVVSPKSRGSRDLGVYFMNGTSTSDDENFASVHYGKEGVGPDAELLIYQFLSSPTLSDGHELWVGT